MAPKFTKQQVKALVSGNAKLMPDGTITTPTVTGDDDEYEEDSAGEDAEGSEEGDSSGSDEDVRDYRRGGYHVVTIGDVFNHRYKVLCKLGWGHFSTVWLVEDLKKDSRRPGQIVPGDKVLRAMKVVKSASNYTDAARDEIQICKALAEGDPNDDKCCVLLLDDFEHVGPHGRHVCMIFEVLGSNLLELIKRYNYRGAPIPICKSIIKQILISLDYLPDRKVIHTDLKPENVLLFRALPKAARRQHKMDVLRQSQSIRAGDHDHSERAFEREQLTPSPSGSSSALDSVVASAKSWMGLNDSAEISLTDSGGSGNSLTASTDSLVAAMEDLALRDRNPRDSVDGEPSASSTPGPVALEEMTPAERTLFENGLGARDLDVNDPETYRVKLADFGNACWTNRHFTNDVQTRQYRSPEVVVGAKWGSAIDWWSLGCMAFELVTGDLLLEPKESKSFGKADDHLAQMIELLGRFPRKLWANGRHSQKYFNRRGQLRAITTLKNWPLKDVLLEKYKFDPIAAEEFADFLTQMLRLDPETRLAPRDMLNHKWLADAPMPKGFEKVSVSQPSNGEPNSS